MPTSKGNEVPMPPLVLEDFDETADEWPHPGGHDPGDVTELFYEMQKWWPEELRNADGTFRPPSPSQLAAIFTRSGTEVYVALEMYLAGPNDEGKRWADPTMQEIMAVWLNGTPSLEQWLYVTRYALHEHQPEGVA